MNKLLKIGLAILLASAYHTSAHAVPVYDQSFDENDRVRGSWFDGGADEFSFESDVRVDNLVFWGTYWTGGNFIENNFNIRIGTELGAGDLLDITGTPDEAVNTGYRHNDFGTAYISAFSFDFSKAIEMVANVTYYLTIASVIEPGENPFVWERVSSDSTDKMWILDATAGRLSRMDGSNYAFQLNGMPAAEIPEPATLALLGLGLFGLSATRKRNARV